MRSKEYSLLVCDCDIQNWTMLLQKTGAKVVFMKVKKITPDQVMITDITEQRARDNKTTKMVSVMDILRENK